MQRRLSRSRANSLGADQPLTKEAVEEVRRLRGQIAVLERRRKEIRENPEYPFEELRKEQVVLAERYLTLYKELQGPDKKAALKALTKCLEQAHLVELQEESVGEPDDLYESDSEEEGAAEASVAAQLGRLRDEKQDLIDELLRVPGVASKQLSSIYKLFDEATNKSADTRLLSSLIRRYFLEGAYGDLKNTETRYSWLKFNLLSHHPGGGETLSDAIKRIADAESALLDLKLPVPKTITRLLRGPAGSSAAGTAHPPSPPPPMSFTSTLHANKGHHHALQPPFAPRRRRHVRQPSNLQHAEKAYSSGEEQAHSLGQLSARKRAIYSNMAGRMGY
ncbi:hypothetical protein JCM6882_006501 [Rhodosporidiobolus microsporus]